MAELPSMNREELADVTAARHAARTERARQSIMLQADVLAARSKLQESVLALSGVSGDPDTIMDIMLMTDAFVQRKEDLGKRTLNESAAWLLLRQDMALTDGGISQRDPQPDDPGLVGLALDLAGHRLPGWERAYYFGRYE